MGFLDFIKGELLEIIEWTDDSRETLVHRFPLPHGPQGQGTG